QEAELLVTLLVFVDATMMSIIMLGASLFYEKQEGSLKSVLVTTVKLVDIIISKVMSAVILSFITAIVLSLVGVLVHGANINIPLLLLYATLGASTHITIGLVLVIISKDFNTLLVNYMLFVIVFTLPAIFYATGVIPASWQWFIYISPSYVTQMLINTSIGIMPSTIMHIGGIAYLVALTVITYKTFVVKKFKEYVIRG
ncbi:MAG: ABC transporter permease, partial [Clostridia bacterium]|nr:ABC transporter permease [Clostridia bacterium]